MLVSRYFICPRNGGHSKFAVDTDALYRLLAERFGRTTLVTNRLDWTPAQVAVAYNGQQHVERVFRGLKGGQWLGWGPLHHWTDSKIRVHAFYCLLGVSLLQYLHQKARAVWPTLTMEGLKHELGADPAHRSAVPATGREGTAARRDRHFQANPDADCPGLRTATRRTAQSSRWVIQPVAA